MSMMIEDEGPMAWMPAYIAVSNLRSMVSMVETKYSVYMIQYSTFTTFRFKQIVKSILTYCTLATFRDLDKL
jgi:hypothetical protein